MTFDDLVPLLPLIALAVLVLLQMIAVAIRRDHGLIAALTLAGLAVAFALLPVADAADNQQVTPLIVVDRFATFFLGLLLATAFGVVALSYGYLRRRDVMPEEFYMLVVLGTLGAGVLVTSTHFASFFLGLEVLSVALYSLVAYQRQSAFDVEAGVKYLVLAGVSSAFLLFGMAVVYYELGTMQFVDIAEAVTGPDALDTVLLTGLGLLVVGIGFKLALVPFHMWTPDVYQGAPAPATAFVATVSKGGVFAVVLRFFTDIGFQDHRAILVVFGVLAVASMLVGNLLALLQDNVKRILAYSSIAQLGYLLVALMASGDRALTAASFYLVAYFAAILGAFGVVTLLSGPDRDADRFEDYRGLFWRRPVLASVFGVALISLAGIPVSAGFVGKFLLVAAGAESGLWAPVIVLVVASVIGFFYYLRLLLVIFAEAPAEAPRPVVLSASRPAVATLGVLLVLIIWLGVYPSPLVELIGSLVTL